MSLEARFYTLTFVRWLPVGLTFGLTVLLPMERGLSVAEIGLLLSIQGFIVLGLEIPSGTLADNLGRRPLLLAAALLAIASSALFVIAASFAIFAASFVIQGVYRALDSGPLEAWYVDNAQPLRVPATLARASTILGAAIAFGALVSGGLIAWNPGQFSSALVLPCLVAIAINVVNLFAVAILITVVPRRRKRSTATAPAETEGVLPPDAVGQQASSPGAFRASVRLLRQSRVLRGLLAVEVFWAVAMIGFETLTPLQLADLAGNPDHAGAIFGPASAGAWGLFSVGALAASWLAPRWGVVQVALAARVLNGLMVVGMGMAGGIVGLLIGYGLAYTTHGIAGPMHSALLHREATNANRATILSLNSMFAGASYSIGLVALTAFAGRTSVSAAMVVAGAFSMLGALCYLPALRSPGDSRKHHRSVDLA